MTNQRGVAFNIEEIDLIENISGYLSMPFATFVRFAALEKARKILQEKKLQEVSV